MLHADDEVAVDPQAWGRWSGIGQAEVARRTVVFATLAAGLLAGAGTGASPPPAGGGNAQEWQHALAEFLVGKELDPALTQRAFDALRQSDPAIDGKARLLRRFLAAKEVGSVDALRDTPGFDGVLRETAMAIISCLYLGFAGTPRRGRAADDTIFITYTQALMYRPLKGYVPLPSYAGLGPGYWATPPQAAGSPPAGVHGGVSR